jgi:hypothetical protein
VEFISVGTLVLSLISLIVSVGTFGTFGTIFLLAVFISFHLARCAPPPYPAPLFGGRESTKKKQTKKIVGVGEVAFCFAGGLGLLEGS